jgi:hypothetical protein
MEKFPRRSSRIASAMPFYYLYVPCVVTDSFTIKLSNPMQCLAATGFTKGVLFCCERSHAVSIRDTTLPEHQVRPVASTLASISNLHQVSEYAEVLVNKLSSK